MKKLGKFIKSNTKLFIGIIIGALIFGSVGAVVAGTVASSDITYTNNSQTNVEGALNDLYQKANTWIDPSYIDFTTLATNTKKTVLASSAGICIKRNNKVSCMKRNNWDVEKDHI